MTKRILMVLLCVISTLSITACGANATSNAVTEESQIEQKSDNLVIDTIKENDSLSITDENKATEDMNNNQDTEIKKEIVEDVATKEESYIPVVKKITYRFEYEKKNNEFASGKQLEVNDLGQVTKVKHYGYYDCDVIYNKKGLISAINETYKDGKKVKTKYSYVKKIPSEIITKNDKGESVAKIATETDKNGVVKTMKTTYSDGSTKDVFRYEDGKIIECDHYIDDNLDDTCKITYDEYGNIKKMDYRDEFDSSYLTVFFFYDYIEGKGDIQCDTLNMFLNAKKIFETLI